MKISLFLWVLYKRDLRIYTAEIKKKNVRISQLLETQKIFLIVLQINLNRECYLMNGGSLEFMSSVTLC